MKKFWAPVSLSLLILLLCSCGGMKYTQAAKGAPVLEEQCRARTPIYRHGGFIIARGSIHAHTTMSDGDRSPEELAEYARREGMAVLGVSDHAVGKICYGDKVCVTFNGIERIGYDTYLDRLAKLQADNPDLIILRGVETMPYIWNMGQSPNIIIMGENTHFTVWGVDDPAVYQNMPFRRGLENFKPEPFPGLRPYQEFVDYITGHGGIVHSVHPESDIIRREGPLYFLTEGPAHFPQDLKGLTGFSILPEGYTFTGAPGGPWDTAINDYLLGARDTMPWAHGDSDYHQVQDTLAWAATLFYLREQSEADVYRAMREGRMVALMGSAFNDSYVSEFSVSDGSAPPDAVMLGEKVTVQGPAVVRFRLNREVEGVRYRLIRNGKIMLEGPGCSFEFIDAESWNKNLPAAYRVELTGPVHPEVFGECPHHEPVSKFMTNPVFAYRER